MRYLRDGREHVQRAAAVAVAGYSIETPRLLLASTSPRHPHGLGNGEDQVGRYVMVQGAPQVAGRFPELMRMYKAPPPEDLAASSSTRPTAARGFVRGFSIQTVSPLPIGWAEHVLADGHWGTALREYMRDYNHWSTLGALCELLPRAENRVTLADETDRHGLRVARLDYTQCDNDRANIAYAKRVLHDIWDAAGAQDELTIDRYAHLIGGCRMGDSPAEQRRATATTACGACRTCSSPTAARCRRRARPTRRSRSWRQRHGWRSDSPRGASSRGGPGGTRPRG